MPKITFTTAPDADDVEIDDVSMNDIAAFRAECLTDGTVTCDWDTLRGKLENHDVSRFWWFLTEPERRSIAEMAIKNTLFYTLWYGRSGKSNCEGGEGGISRLSCIHNTIIRYLKFGQDAPIGGDNCYYRRTRSSDEFCYVPDIKYGLPCYECTCATYGPGFGHFMCAIQVNKNIEELDSWIVFQYSSFDIKPGHWQMPVDEHPGNIFVQISVITSLGCSSYNTDELVRWEF